MGEEGASGAGQPWKQDLVAQGGEEMPEGRGGSKARVAAASLQREGGKPASVYIELVRERGDHTMAGTTAQAALADTEDPHSAG